MNKFLFTSILLFGITLNFTYAQNFQKLNKEHQDIVKQVYNVLGMKQNFDLYPDSIAFYPYLIKLKIERDLNNKTVVKDIVASDSIVFKVFPNYLKFKEINFDPILAGSDNLEYRIPILISCVRPSPSQKHLLPTGLMIPYIEMTMGIRAIERLLDLYDSEINENGVNVYQQGAFTAELVRVR